MDQDLIINIEPKEALKLVIEEVKDDEIHDQRLVVAIFGNNDNLINND